LKERIGTGGCGEVWKAEAPGGLLKAVKFVYGSFDESAGSRELEALKQIKEVHHPFLLSLERIEVVDGRLAIVTELAASSLKERFDECRKSGLEAIPRDELLRYLNDGADALDYLYEEHALQHLDVKPENLLLLGNRIKVADFGLVRSLRDTDGAPLGGLTPLYAASEVFRGAPSRTSDQYSLAIVYQHLLTGEPPFTGRTPAQLAAQHHHCKPVLDPLPKPDQAVIARALSKNPNRRFPACRVLVDNLLRAGRQASGSGRARASGRGASGPTPPVEPGRASADQTSVAAKTTPLSLDMPEIESLPAIDLSGETAEYRPAVFIGLGHTGGKTLTGLRRILEDRVGDLEAVPCLKMLLVDVDSRSLAQATEAPDGAALRGEDTFAIPLRHPHQYRDNSRQLLQWIGRRWLYNVPRSLLTEGFRPLGRLALVDHSEMLIERLRSTFVAATDPEAIALSAKNAGIPFQSKPPRVFIIASTAGGTGSGAALDLAYVVREVLVEQGISDEAVYGILTHSTTHVGEERDLAIANTYAFLMELNHLRRAGGHYPGDAAFRLLASYQRDATFQHAYLVHLGDGLDDAQYESAVDGLAEYLYLNCMTPACAFFDRSRERSAEDGLPAQTALRTFAIGKARQSGGGLPDGELAPLCRSLVHLWLGIADGNRDGEQAGQRGPKDAGDAACAPAGAPACKLQDVAEQQASALDLRLAPLVEHAVGIVQSELGCDTDLHFRRVIESVKASRQQPGHTASVQAVAAKTFQVIDELMEKPDPAHDSAAQTEGLHGVLCGKMAPLFASKTKALRQWMVGLLELPDMRLKGAWQAATWFAEHFRTMELAASRVAQRLAEETAGVKELTTGCQAEQQFMQYGRLKVYELAHRHVRDGAHAMCLEMTAIADEFQMLRDGLTEVADRFESHCSTKPDQHDSDCVPDANDRGRPPLVRRKVELSPPLVDAMDEQMRTRFAGADRSLYDMLAGKMHDQDLLCDALRETVRAVLRRQSKEPASRSSDPGPEDVAGESSDVRAWVDQSRPKLMECGGARRMLMVVADPSDVAPLKRNVEQATGEGLTALSYEGSHNLLCCEVERVPLDNVAASLIDGRREYAEMASRLHTRIDVKWPVP